MKDHCIKTLFHLFSIFFKAGTFTFAGGLAMLPVIKKDVVERYKFMPEDEFLEYATLSQTLPGVIALNCAVFVGRRTAGTAGMIIAGIGATISAFALMIAATVMLNAVPQEGAVVGALRGIRAAAAALVLSAAFSIGKHNLKSVFSVSVMLAAFALVLFGGISAVIVVFAAGASGYAWQIIAAHRAVNGGNDR